MFELLGDVGDGRLSLRLDIMTVAECVWVLSSVYGRARGEIASALSDLLTAEGILSDDKNDLLEALHLFATHPVDFADALLAARVAGSSEVTLYSFDRDFDRMPGVRRLEPGAAGAASEGPQEPAAGTT